MKWGCRMIIRKASLKDFDFISSKIKLLSISYITPDHIRNDIEMSRQYVLEENGNIIAIAAIIWDAQYNYYALKRLCVLESNMRGKGYAREMIRFLSTQVRGRFGCTPWTDNIKMRMLLENENFKLEYIFNGHWCFYLKE